MYANIFGRMTVETLLTLKFLSRELVPLRRLEKGQVHSNRYISGLGVGFVTKPTRLFCSDPSILAVLLVESEDPAQWAAVKDLVPFLVRKG